MSDTSKIVCSTDECDRAPIARGFCYKHYNQLRRAGKLDVRQYYEGQACSFEGCESLAKARGLCRRHYTQWWQTERPRCVICTCVEPGISRSGLCAKHYKRWHDHDDPLWEPKKAAHGAGSIDRNGYRMVTIDHHRVAEHRHVMEQLLGRRLTKDENVHHVNGVRHDNRPVNLELWSSAQPSGQRVEDKLAWCREFITRYGGDFEQPRLRFE